MYEYNLFGFIEIQENSLSSCLAKKKKTKQNKEQKCSVYEMSQFFFFYQVQFDGTRKNDRTFCAPFFDVCE